MWVLISFALSAYLRVFVVWWYWSALDETVASIIVRELPLNPSFNNLVNLLHDKRANLLEQRQKYFATIYPGSLQESTILNN
jgi:hypothetical protein